MCRWKNYENRSIFSKEMDKSIVCGFFGPPCMFANCLCLYMAAINQPFWWSRDGSNGVGEQVGPCSQSEIWSPNEIFVEYNFLIWDKNLAIMLVLSKTAYLNGDRPPCGDFWATQSEYARTAAAQNDHWHKYLSRWLILTLLVTFEGIGQSSWSLAGENLVIYVVGATSNEGFVGNSVNSLKYFLLLMQWRKLIEQDIIRMWWPTVDGQSMVAETDCQRIPSYVSLNQVSSFSSPGKVKADIRWVAHQIVGSFKPRLRISRMGARGPGPWLLALTTLTHCAVYWTHGKWLVIFLILVFSARLIASSAWFTINWIPIGESGLFEWCP